MRSYQSFGQSFSPLSFRWFSSFSWFTLFSFCFSGKFTNPNESQSEFSIRSCSILHLRYCFDNIRQLGAFMFPVYFIHCKYLSIWSRHSPSWSKGNEPRSGGVGVHLLKPPIVRLCLFELYGLYVPGPPVAITIYSTADNWIWWSLTDHVIRGGWLKYDYGLTGEELNWTRGTLFNWELFLFLQYLFTSLQLSFLSHYFLSYFSHYHLFYPLNCDFLSWFFRPRSLSCIALISVKWTPVKVRGLRVALSTVD